MTLSGVVDSVKLIQIIYYKWLLFFYMPLWKNIFCYGLLVLVFKPLIHVILLNPQSGNCLVFCRKLAIALDFHLAFRPCSPRFMPPTRRARAEINGQIKGNMWYFLQKLLLPLELEELLIHSFYIQSSGFTHTHVYDHGHQK